MLSSNFVALLFFAFLLLGSSINVLVRTAAAQVKNPSMDPHDNPADPNNPYTRMNDNMYMPPNAATLNFYSITGAPFRTPQQNAEAHGLEEGIKPALDLFDIFQKGPEFLYGEGGLVNFLEGEINGNEFWRENVNGFFHDLPEDLYKNTLDQIRSNLIEENNPSNTEPKGEDLGKLLNQLDNSQGVKYAGNIGDYGEGNTGNTGSSTPDTTGGSNTGGEGSTGNNGCGPDTICGGDNDGPDGDSDEDDGVAPTDTSGQGQHGTTCGPNTSTCGPPSGNTSPCGPNTSTCRPPSGNTSPCGPNTSTCGPPSGNTSPCGPNTSTCEPASDNIGSNTPGNNAS